MEQSTDSKIARVVIRDRCSACGAVLDEQTAFRITRAKRTYCCRCYLKHDASGTPLPVQDGPTGGYSFTLSGSEHT
jgi:hypothetical protein